MAQVRKIPAKEALLMWIRKNRYVLTSSVNEWGNLHHSNRAERNARQLATEGRIKRLSKEQQNKIFGKVGKERSWVFVRMTMR